MDLHCWIHPLNLIDAALRWCLATYPNLLLIVPVERKPGTPPPPNTNVADSLQEVEQVPSEIVPRLIVLLHFLEQVLQLQTLKTNSKIIPEEYLELKFQ